ncbi:MAG: imidazole glycerol phosphate synthase subunit HisH [Deinococcota bacterium]
MDTVLIDYGASNLHSVHKALEHAGFSVCLTDSPERAAQADVLVSPGQGHFGQVMERFLAGGYEPVVRAHLRAGKPFLGICVGLQILMEASEEAPDVPGLGLLAGRARRFPEGSGRERVSVPQMGWNQLFFQGNSPLFAGIKDGAFVYFANSYYVEFDEAVVHASVCAEPTTSQAQPQVTSAVTHYGRVSFRSAVSLGAIHATQFHPEKSQHVGLQILGNFHRHAGQVLADLASQA